MGDEMKNRLLGWTIAALAVAILGDALPAAAQARPATFRDCAVCPEMVAIPAGDFTMGSPNDEAGRNTFLDEDPPHRVSVARFAAGMFEVTFNQWGACVEGGGCASQPIPRDEGWGRGNRPVIDVSWSDSREYVRWLSNQTGRTYRLLSEAEWEYAARGGRGDSPYWWGAIASHLFANYGTGFTSPVGSFPANPFGLHDMHGNVLEWVQDCHHNNYYGCPSNGSAWTTNGDCSRRVLRGGYWGYGPRNLRSAFRLSGNPSIRGPSIGFRVARTL